LKKKLCASPIGQLVGGILTPYRAMTGGIIPKWCPGPLDANAADLGKPADSAEGAAARIKASEAEAKARRAAVRYLGTVDCKRYPEAEAALINALRGDPNECVRLEAALAFRNGCCCSKKVIDTLIVVVNGEKTTEPAETSPRVRCAAAEALQRCLKLACDTETPRPPEKPVIDPKKEAPEPGVPDKSTIPGNQPGQLPPPKNEGKANGQSTANRQSSAEDLQRRAREALARFWGISPSPEPPLAQATLPVATPTPPSTASLAPTPQPIPVGFTGLGPTIQVVSRPTAPSRSGCSAKIQAPNAVAPTSVLTEKRLAPMVRTTPPTGQRSLWQLFIYAAGN
ncbi:MAG: hypothetical protein SNJ82_12120, partial [Gemmataceae bacterium]